MLKRARGEGAPASRRRRRRLAECPGVGGDKTCRVALGGGGGEGRTSEEAVDRYSRLGAKKGWLGLSHRPPARPFGGLVGLAGEAPSRSRLCGRKFAGGGRGAAWQPDRSGAEGFEEGTLRGSAQSLSLRFAASARLTVDGGRWTVAVDEVLLYCVWYLLRPKVW